MVSSADGRFQFTGKERDVAETGYDYFGARYYDSWNGRWLSVDPMGEKYSGWSAYNYVRCNPLVRIDPTGMWDIAVHFGNTRSPYLGIAIVTDRHGNEVFRFTVRGEGIGGTDRMQTNADTPIGTYDIPDDNAWKSGGSRAAFGPNPRLVMTPESGEIVNSGRDLIRIHGGRQEKYDPKADTWEPVDNPELEKTEGCLRAFDADMRILKEMTDALQKNDSKEIPGKVTVVNDLPDPEKKSDEIARY